jgi:hypothetical protein
MMFITFFLPTFVEHSQLSGQLYRQMEAMTKDNLHIIAPEYYFNEHTNFPETHHIRQAWLQKQFYPPYPTQAEIDSFSKSIYPNKLLTKIKQHSSGCGPACGHQGQQGCHRIAQANLPVRHRRRSRSRA